MKNKIVVCLLALMVATPTVVRAEFVCHVDVSYSWKKEKAEQPLDVFYSTIQSSAADEAGAKAGLVDTSAREQSKAMEDCRKQHENRSGCIAAKYTANANLLQMMKAEARKVLEEAIASDCASTQGSCLKATLSEPKCAEAVKASESPTPAPGKDAKAKKK